MRRVFWVAVGAAGGIWAYRRARAMSEQAREQGVLLTAHQTGQAATSALETARGIASGAVSQLRALQEAQARGAATGSPITREQGE